MVHVGKIDGKGGRVDTFYKLKQAAGDDWATYVGHRFVRLLGEGTLPEAALRAYLVQDYFF
jgi:thiaminase/transcriptional activator TenA